MNLSQLNKKMLTLIGIVVAVIIIAISIINKDRNLSFDVIENKMKTAAINYLKDNEELLPKENGDRVVISVVDLENGKYLPLMSKMVKDETICNGEVRVLKNNNEYLYMPYLNCGSMHVTTELARKIKEQDIVTEGEGLYEMNGEFIYRGENVRNYVLFNDRKWRILKIDKENNIKIFDETYRDLYSTWDDRYNPNRESNDGYNNFEKSRIYNKLKELFNDEKYLSSKSKALVVPKDLCVGKRSLSANGVDGSIECSAKLENEPLGLMQVNEYLVVSLESKCKKAEDRICQNYNYLSNVNGNWASITAIFENNYQVYQITPIGIFISTASNELNVQPTLYLTSNLIYKGGIGTFDDPYIIK